MKEFMLLVRNLGEQKATLPAEEHTAFLKACETYIEMLKKENRLIAAQPLSREGKVLSGKAGNWKETLLDATEQIRVGYYHILANNQEEAEAIAKQNPEFAYSDTASIEVRPIKTKEPGTGYGYPTNRGII